MQTLPSSLRSAYQWTDPPKTNLITRALLVALRTARVSNMATTSGKGLCDSSDDGVGLTAMLVASQLPLRQAAQRPGLRSLQLRHAGQARGRLLLPRPTSCRRLREGLATPPPASTSPPHSSPISKTHRWLRPTEMGEFAILYLANSRAKPTAPRATLLSCIWRSLARATAQTAVPRRSEPARAQSWRPSVPWSMATSPSGEAGSYISRMSRLRSPSSRPRHLHQRQPNPSAASP